jgi:cystathionine gamma-synthase
MSSQSTQDLSVETEPLGQPIPASEHAISMSLPRWQHVVGYEEKHPHIVERLQTGYPRFLVHRLVKQVAERFGNQTPTLPFPSRKAAEACAEFVERRSGTAGKLVTRDGIWGVSVADSGAQALRDFWQHTGLVFSSRRAEAFLEGRPAAAAREDAALRQSLKRQLACFYECNEDDVFLQASGMAAQYAALRAVQERSPDLPTVQLGFPYVDTLKLQQKFGPEAHLLHDLDHIETELLQLLERMRVAACFCEIPGNPLLGSADLKRISPLLRARGIPVVVDDVVATPFNVDLGGYADLVATSLTKFIAGTCDVMGGALVCNPRSSLHAQIKPILQAQHEELLWWEDVLRLHEQAREFPKRMMQHNRNGLFLAERLRAHPAVERVWYPKWEFSVAYEAVRRPSGGWGALVTFLPRNAETRAEEIYDRLPVRKGPSLGTVFTLACPFTLLAHYTELEWAEACGVSRFLIRVSAGLEEPEQLWEKIRPALDQASPRIAA